jgi:[histone H3]-trimethyl-L-lysine4 demethylase
MYLQLKMGRECINHYSLLRRFCVFSHDELVCKMALEPDKLNSGIATACYLDMAEMVDCEKKLRKSLLEWVNIIIYFLSQMKNTLKLSYYKQGVTKADREAFELLPDDERQCEVCKTTCFLSAVTCTCSSVLTCLRHYTALCQCSPEKHTLKYRYTLDELPLMLRKLKVKAESFENWLTRVRNVLDPNTPTNITLDDLQDLAQEAEDKRFPGSILLERLNSAVLEAEKCVTVIQQLDINKIRTRTRNSNSEMTKYKLTMDELDMFVQEIDNLCCIIQEGNSVRELQQMGHEFVKKADVILDEICLNQIDVQDMHKCIEAGVSLCIELPQVITLKDRLKQVQWYQMCTQLRDFSENNKHPTLSTLKKIFDEGMQLTPYPSIEKELAEIQSIVVQTEEWEICAKQCFENGTQHQLPEIEALIERADIIFCILPSLPQLRDALKKSKEWLTTVEILQGNENYPYFNTLENVVSRGKNIPFQLEELKRMDEYLNSARNWKDRTCRTFLRKNTLFTLMDALSPRADAIMIPSRQRKKLSGEKIAEKFTEELGPVQMVIAFKQAEEKEMRDMRNLRELNINKNPEKDNYCICKRSFCGIMYNCQLCKDWFHSTCVPTPKNTVRQRPPGAVVEQPSFVLPSVIGKKDREEDKYLCPSCMRSRRPRLETILSLLVSLQRLPLRLPEGEALQCLTERAMNWQDRARQALSSDDVASALARLSMISQKSTETDVNKEKPSKPSVSDVRSRNTPQILHKHKKRKKRNTNISPVPTKLNDNAVEKQKMKTILTTLTSTITSSDSNYNTEEEDLCDRINDKDYESSNSSQSPTT